MNRGDLDRRRVYTWRVGGVNLGGEVITGARVTFKNIRNWDDRANTRFHGRSDRDDASANANRT